MKPKPFIFIADDLAAEQRPIVAHSASYGSRPLNFIQAPAGAKEIHLNSRPNLSPLPGLEIVSHLIPTVATVGYCQTPLRGWDKTKFDIK